MALRHAEAGEEVLRDLQADRGVDRVSWSPSRRTSVVSPVVVLKSETIGQSPERAIGTFSSSARVCARAELISGLLA